MRKIFVALLLAVGICVGKDYYDKLDRVVIACHSTDFTCFKKQYQSFRDNVFLGNLRLGIQDYAPYRFQYGSGSCIKMSGLEESNLVGVGMDSDTREYTFVLELPLKLQQVENNTSCEVPEKEFRNVPPQTGPLKKFTGNATIQVVFPYDLKKKKGKTYMALGDEGLDVILDIPDLSDFKTMSEDDLKEYELAEWAYDVVQHINAADDFALPYTSRIRSFTENVAMERYLLLYPEEEYTDIHFYFTESPHFDQPSNDK